jgi:predicted amidophosphoribosyltransferase
MRRKNFCWDCLQKLQKEFQESEYTSDRQMYSNVYQLHRRTLLELNPTASEELRRLKFPESLDVK